MVLAMMPLGGTHLNSELCMASKRIFQNGILEVLQTVSIPGIGTNYLFQEITLSAKILSR